MGWAHLPIVTFMESPSALPYAHIPTLTIIRGSKSAWKPPFRELWEYRELLYFLTWRDIKVRYKQTILGVAWAVVQPLIIAMTLSLFLGQLAKVPSEGLPYPVFAFS